MATKKINMFQEIVREPRRLNFVSKYKREYWYAITITTLY